jgi:hypothetical protein
MELFVVIHDGIYITEQIQRVHLAQLVNTPRVELTQL